MLIIENILVVLAVVATVGRVAMLRPRARKNKQ
jgi:hypothetical protein